MSADCFDSLLSLGQYFRANEGIFGSEIANSPLYRVRRFDYRKENDVLSTIQDLDEPVQTEVNRWLRIDGRHGDLEPKELVRLIKTLENVADEDLRKALLRSPFFQIGMIKDPVQWSREAVYLEFLITQNDIPEEYLIEFLDFWKGVMQSEHADMFSSILDRCTPHQMMELSRRLASIMSEKEIGQFTIILASHIRLEQAADFQEFIDLISFFPSKTRRAVLEAMQRYTGNVMTVKEFSSFCFSIEPLSEQVSHLFDELGKINAKEMALVIAAKQKDGKAHRQSIFVIEDLMAFYKVVHDLAVSPTEKSQICFQYVTRINGHSCFGEVTIDKSREIPHLKIFLYDPSSPESGFDQEFDALKEMDSQDVKVTLIAPKSEEKLQRGIGCSYFSLDGAFMLSNQRQFENLYPKMEPCSSEDFRILEIDIPTRLKRGSHHLHEISADDELFALGLNSSILNHPENSRKIVNHKGNTAAESVQKYLKKMSCRSIHNKRIDHKREAYQQDVKEYIRQNGIMNEVELSKAIRPFTQEGFYAYAKKLKNEAVYTEES